MPVWSGDGRELFYRIGDRMMAVTVETEPQFRASAPVELFEGHYGRTRGGEGSNYDASPDGTRFLMLSGGERPSQLEVIVNWSRAEATLEP